MNNKTREWKKRHEAEMQMGSVSASSAEELLHLSDGFERELDNLRHRSKAYAHERLMLHMHEEGYAVRAYNVDTDLLMWTWHGTYYVIPESKRESAPVEHHLEHEVIRIEWLREHGKVNG